MPVAFIKGKSSDGLDKELLRKLNVASLLSGEMFLITSALRKDDKKSSHSKGLAVDIHTQGSRHRFLILKGLVDAGFTRIGVYPRHIHVDIDLSRGLNVIWYGEYKKK